MARSACFVTPSYAGDFDRCRLLVESRKECAPSIPHYIIVDRPDLPMFKTLAGLNTMIVDSRELLDKSLVKLWGRNHWWVSGRAPPARGWITQQIRKMAMPRISNADILINVDSDVVFVRPFAVDLLMREDRLALFQVDFENEQIRNWSRIAGRLLGCAPPSVTQNHVGMLIPWWRESVDQMLASIEAKQHLPWQIAVARQRTFSEYVTYGVHAHSVTGLAAAHHFADDRALVQTSWDKPTDTPSALSDLFASVCAQTVAVMVHSKDNISPANYRAHVERMWREGWTERTPAIRAREPGWTERRATARMAC